MADPVKRLNYFDQQFLRIGDFKAEQDYHRRMLREHNRSLHPPGIASGLTVAAAGTGVTVSPGTAVTADGEEIVLADPQTLDLADQTPGQPVYVTIAYRVQTSDPDPATSNPTRITDTPLIGKSLNAPADPDRSLILGVAQRTGTTVTAIASGGRKRSGETLAGPLTIQGALNAAAGANAGGVSIGRDPGTGVDYPFEYETVGVTQPIYNLRLQSPNNVIVHAGGAERATFHAGGLSIQGTVNAGGGAIVNAVSVGRDPGGGTDYPWNYETVGVLPGFNLRLQSPNSVIVHSGGAVRGQFHPGGLLLPSDDRTPWIDLIVGSGRNGGIRTRHIDGKHYMSDAHDALYLNYSNGQRVVVNGNPGSRAWLHVGADDLGGLPNWSGGGVIAWDVFARGWIYTGGVNASVKKFVIDHPCDPERRELEHACLEGPEIAVYYRGEGQLRDGEATIRLPHYFEALTEIDGRTIIVTPLLEDDEPVCRLGATRVREGSFRVRGDAPEQRFYWEVKAVRADMEALEVERLKDREGVAAAGR